MLFSNLIPRAFSCVNTFLPMLIPKAGIHSIMGASSIPSTSTTVGGAWSLISSRTNIRNHFPRAREGKRIKIYGYLKRMSTPSGRRVLMRRILKGRHVLSH